MSSLTVWQPTRAIAQQPERAAARFAAALESQRALFADSLGHPFRVESAISGGTHIGLVTWDMGVLGHRAWSADPSGGLAWAGVCETAIGTDVGTVWALLMDDRWPIVDHEGRFVACAWDDHGGVLLATAALDSPSFWEVSGPDGSAYGSRSAHLFELVGAKPELDLDAVRLYLSYGYLVGDRNLLGARRVPARTRLELAPSQAPRRSTSVDLGTVLQHPDAPAADRLRDRVARQRGASEEPVLLLTGGRDSRVLGAALAANGFSGPSITGGPPGSADVVIAEQVARALGIQQEAAAAETAALRSAVGGPPSVERSLDWIRLSEGLQGLRQGTSQRRFFAGVMPVPERRRQVFHGLGGETARGYYYLGSGLDRAADLRRATAVLAERAHGPWLAADVRPMLAAALDDLDAELDELRPSMAQWLDAFYWQRRGLHWGADLLSTSDLIDWHWAPFMDRTWVATAWHLPTGAKGSNRFVESLAVELAPALARVPYDASSARRWTIARMGSTAHRLVGRAAAGRRARNLQREARLHQLWRDLFTDEERPWTGLVPHRLVSERIEREPDAEFLWDLATVELVCRAFLD